ncbi:patatin-like phospholipase family protein [Streptomyces sp. NPDC056400]|uniref:patatin-like phospholipase family protein n=1 Tax=Streptomyces sp. NPDC056400 TaxID=3345808 RepID=UPI0035E1A541
MTDRQDEGRFSKEEPEMDDRAHEERAESGREGTGLCLSGGGYRAMLFHAGALRRLNDAGWLRKIDFISSVSGGSIAAGVLGRYWNRLRFNDADESALNFDAEVVDRIRALARLNIDRRSVIGGLLRPRASIGERVAAAFRDNLFGDFTLQDLPERPRFIITATNLQTGKLWRFSRPYMWDWSLPKIEFPTTSLATAVAASSAFPPFLSPVRMSIAPSEWLDPPGWNAQLPDHVILSDAGVYDNLGLEPVIKRCETVLVSDGGGQMESMVEIPHDWPRHLLRVLDVIDNQVRSLRKRSLISSYQDGSFRGAYWGIRSDIEKYRLLDAFPVTRDLTQNLAKTPTRLHALPDDTQEQLINWGYAICDAGLRSQVDTALNAPASLPYPKSSLELSRD